MPRPLFVYGTLRDADVRTLVLGRRLAPAALQAAMAPGYEAVYLRGRLYPALRRAPGAAAGAGAEGLLVSGLAPAELAALDAFEGVEYRRGPIDLIVSGQPAAADVYWPAVEPGEAAAWRLEEWVRRHKAAFLSAQAADMAAWRSRLTALAR